jgi:hypothetical protein
VREPPYDADAVNVDASGRWTWKRFLPLRYTN